MRHAEARRVITPSQPTSEAPDTQSGSPVRPRLSAGGPASDLHNGSGMPHFASMLRISLSRCSLVAFWSGQGNPGAFSRLWMKKLNAVFERAKVGDGHSHRFRDTLPSNYCRRVYQSNASVSCWAFDRAHHRETLRPMGQSQTGAARSRGTAHVGRRSHGDAAGRTKVVAISG